jgi:hypothetical protein
MVFVGFLMVVFFFRYWSTSYTNRWIEEARESSKPTFPVSTYPTMYVQPVSLTPINNGTKTSPEDKQKTDPRISQPKASRNNPPQPRR